MLNTAVIRLFATTIVLTLLGLLVHTEHATAASSVISAERGCSPPAEVQEALTVVEAPAAIEPPKPEVGATEKLGTTLTMEVSGYTSEAGQTDSRPCEAADQSDICRRKAKGELICASNAFPLGTRLHVAGLGSCTVADRMNRRYRSHVDWYFGQDTESDDTRLRRALKIGRRDRRVTVLSIPE
jgi:3D (Asp-Asp-Asp) domain-containing protein